MMLAGLALALAASACARRGPLGGRVSSAPAKPKLSAPATSPSATNEWRPVVSPIATTVGAPVAPAAPASVPVPAPLRPTMAVTAPAPTVRPMETPPSPRAPPAPVLVGVTGVTGVTSVLDAPMGYRLRPGDPVIINLRGIMPRDEEIECMVDEGGFIKVPYLERIKAAGLSTSQLEDEIERRYVDGKIYRTITVGVIMPSKSYFIQGEVKLPGRVQLLTPVTLLQVIAQAGGYTDYADQTDVRIIRAGRTLRFNAKDLARFPERDVRIEPGDVINVTRGLL
jgi:protein involved in polysaccharide export with SLBB domain